MKKINLSTLLFGLLLSAISYGQNAAKDQAAVQHTVEKLFAALSNLDTAALQLNCTNQVRFYEYGQVWTVDTLIQKVMQSRSIPDFKRTNSFEFVHTAINQKTAWVTYYLQSAFTRNGKKEIIKWMETVVLLQEKKQWKINVLHSTRLLNN